MSPRIFISYRREDSQGSTGRLYDRLSQAFTPDMIFMDVDTMVPGADFVRELNEAVLNCDVLLAIIGGGWLDATTADGGRRIEDGDDFVRIEITTALHHGIRVIPVLVDGAQMPAADELPGELKPLARRHAVEISHPRFMSDVDRLIDTLKRKTADHDSGDAPIEDDAPLAMHSPGGSGSAALSDAGRYGAGAPARPEPALSNIRTAGIAGSVLALYSFGGLVGSLAPEGAAHWAARLETPVAILMMAGGITGPPLAFAVWLPKFTVGHFWGTFGASCAAAVMAAVLGLGWALGAMFAPDLMTSAPNSFEHILYLGLREVPQMALIGAVLGYFLAQALRTWFPNNGGPGFVRRMTLIWLTAALLFAVTAFFMLTIAEAVSVKSATGQSDLILRSEVKMWAETVVYGLAWALALVLTFRLAPR